MYITIYFEENVNVQFIFSFVYFRQYGRTSFTIYWCIFQAIWENQFYYLLVYISGNMGEPVLLFICVYFRQYGRTSFTIYLFIFQAIWENQFYYLFGFLFLVFIILVISVSQISIVMVYFQLCGEVSSWYWNNICLPYYYSGQKGSPGASSNQMVCLHVSLSARNSIRPTYKVQYLKFGWR